MDEVDECEVEVREVKASLSVPLRDGRCIEALIPKRVDFSCMPHHICSRVVCRTAPRLCRRRARGAERRRGPPVGGSAPRHGAAIRQRGSEGRACRLGRGSRRRPRRGLPHSVALSAALPSDSVGRSQTAPRPPPARLWRRSPGDGVATAFLSPELIDSTARRPAPPGRPGKPSYRLTNPVVRFPVLFSAGGQ